MPDTDETATREPENPDEGTPRWVKVSAGVLILIVLVAVVLKMTGLAPNHGPSRHASETKTAERTTDDSAQDVHERARRDHG